MPIPLPFPYLPGEPGSGLGDPQTFADSVQGNFDALAIAVGNQQAIPALKALTASGYSVQWGAGTASIGASTDSDFVVTLPTAWSSAHAVFLAQPWANSSWSGFGIRGSTAAGLTTGTLHVANGTTAQSFIYVWISIGK